jgi:serine/threonine-protein kinase ATR
LAEQVHRLAEGEKKPANILGLFMELHMLGLVASISEVINDIRDQYSITEKGRCVQAIEEMVKVAKNHTRVARPQVCALSK